MSRVAKKPLELPSGVELNVSGQRVTLKGAKGSLNFDMPAGIALDTQDKAYVVKTADAGSRPLTAMAGTVRALLGNMAKGVSEGFERKLALVGVGYRAQAQGKNLNLTLGFSHPVDYPIPDGITVETPSQTEIVVRGVDKQLVGQVSAEIRAYRPPEPYKGKGVRYADERVIMKEAKKK